MLTSVHVGRQSAALLSTLLLALLMPFSAHGDVVLGDGDNLVATGFQQTMAFGEVCVGESYDLTAGIVLLRNGTNTDRIWVNSTTIDFAVVNATSGLSAATPASATLPADWQTQQNTALQASSSVVTLTPAGPLGAKTGTIEYSATGASVTNTSWTDTDLMQVTWTVIDCPEISITKSVDADYVVVGDDIPYRYEVENTGSVDLFDVTVVDDTCSSVDKVTNGNGTLEPGEIWEYECEMPATLAQASTLLTNTAEVSAFTDGEDEVTDEDSFTLQALALRKQVAIYWDYLNYVADPAAGDVVFTAKLYKDTVLVGEETFSRNSPLYVWLTPGAWSIEEATPPVGYRIFRGNWNVGTVPSASYLDNTFFNGSDFDLAITKAGPKLVEVGEDVLYTYSVTNTGPAAVTPLVSDDECSPVTYDDGDTVVADGKIQATETWTFSCTTTTTQGDWAGAFPAGDLTNTATVIDDELDDLAAPYGLFGGDTDLTNNEDTYSLYPFVLRKDVRLYDDGGSIPFSDPSTMFTVKATMDGFTDYLMITEDDPAYLWLADGTWTFQETGIPQGYYPLHDYYATGFTHTTGQYPDWTIVNITWSGCSHGYWKNHLDAWPTGYDPDDLIGDYFPGSGYFDGDTLEEALRFGGGGGVRGAEKILLRQAVAALLNEAEYGTAYGPYIGVDALKTSVNAALASGDRTVMLDLAGTLDHWNNGVCR